jgi:hypothetical protein
MKFLGRSLSFAFTAWLAATTASPLFANDWYVDVSDPNCASGTGSSTAPFCNIQKAIDAAYDGDTIHVRAGSYLENLSLAKDLVLIGESGASTTVVDGNQMAAVATIEAGRLVTMVGLTLTHGYALAGGGVTIRAGADVTLDHCVVSNNTAYVDLTAASASDEVHGGGIAADHATLTLIGTAIDANEAKIVVDGDDSTGNAFGGGIWIWQGVLHMQQTTLSGNKATANGGLGHAANMLARGGGIASIGSSLDGDSSSISANRATATWSNPWMGQSYAADVGGAWLDHGSAAMTRFDVGDNVATTSSGRGGGILVDGGSLQFERGAIHGNAAVKGGGIASFGDASVTLIDSTVEENREGSGSSGSFGGGGLAVSGSSSLTMAGCHVFENEGIVSGCGLSVDAGASAQVIASRFDHNHRYATGTYPYPDGGAIICSGTLLLEDCFIAGSDDPTLLRHGGAILSSGNLTMRRCVVTNGEAIEGGGLYNTGVAELDDTAVIQNEGYGSGSGCYNAGTGQLTLHGCTVAGNRNVPGIYNESTALLDARHTIFTGDAATGAPVFYGTLTSDGYDLLTSKDNCTIVGDETGNQYLVDPLFVDPDGGDFTLQSISPAVDAGDPAETPGGADAAAHPRWLDGDLDHVRILDLGAFEFDHAQLSVTTQGIPGAILTVDVAGTSGLYGILVLGLAQGEIDWWPFGTLFVDLSAPAWFLPIGTQPYTLTGTIPNDAPDGTTFVFQSVAVSLVNGAGNMSNFAVVTVRQP